MPTVRRRLLIVLPLWSLACAAQAQIHQCTDAAGARYYQDRPCAAGQRAVPFDPDAVNLTTFDSASARREVQGALATHEQIQALRRQEAEAQAARDPIAQDAPQRDAASVQGGEPQDERGVVLLPYPVHHDRDDRDDRRPPRSPPTSREAPAGGYALDPPRMRDVAPRPRSSGREALEEAPTARR